MKNLQPLIRMSIALGVLSLIALGISFLALTDIRHGEADVSLEWKFLNFAALILLMYIFSGVVTLFRVLRFAKRGE